MATIRQQKVASQIQRIVAMVLQRDIGDPRVDGLISVTKVETSPDLREAKVFLSFLGNKKPAATVLNGIKSAGRHIQSEVAENLPLRFVPRLTFVIDESLKRQAEILKKIDEVMGTKDKAPTSNDETISGDDASDEE